jgi:hypothetical protein
MVTIPPASRRPDHPAHSRDSGQPSEAEPVYRLGTPIAARGGLAISAGPAAGARRQGVQSRTSADVWVTARRDREGRYPDGSKGARDADRSLSGPGMRRTRGDHPVGGRGQHQRTHTSRTDAVRQQTPLPATGHVGMAAQHAPGVRTLRYDHDRPACPGRFAERKPELTRGRGRPQSTSVALIEAGTFPTAVSPSRPCSWQTRTASCPGRPDDQGAVHPPDRRSP